jgi:hypothetical protein
MPRSRVLSRVGVGVALCGALALGLAACVGPRTVSHVSSKNDVFLYLPVSTLPLEVAGNPFPGAADQAVTAAVARGMSGNVNGRPLTFIPTSDGRDGPNRPGYRTVVFLSGGGIVAGHDLCRGGLPHPGAKGGTLHASGALCDGPEMVAWAEAWGGPVTPAPDGAFLSLMDRLADAVFKREFDRDHDHDFNGAPWP